MKIFIASNPTEAHLVCELLKQAQIGCEVRGDGLFGLRGELPFDEGTAPYVWLLERDKRAEAQQIVDDFIKPVQASRQPHWRCRHCGEINELQFAVCWQCGCADCKAR